ncbi:Pentatricopeptide repeat-containing protein, mitochondrial [Trifolium repens]|nr:Pentatricopeptide repeat-containing protein, mitochondrial [Trifolium repens]
MLNQLLVKPFQRTLNTYHLYQPKSLFCLQLTTVVESPQDDATVAKLVLQSDPKSLSETLSNHTFQWTPNLVNNVLKRLWNHGPKALQFFKHLDRHPTYIHSTSAFEHAIDIAARLREYNTAWALVARMRALRCGPTPKTFAILAERYATGGKAHRAVKVFLSMHEHGCHQDLNSFNTILDVLCKTKRVEMAYNLFKTFKGFEGDGGEGNYADDGYL